MGSTAEVASVVRSSVRAIVRDELKDLVGARERVVEVEAERDGAENLVASLEFEVRQYADFVRRHC